MESFAFLGRVNDFWRSCVATNTAAGYVRRTLRLYARTLALTSENAAVMPKTGSQSKVNTLVLAILLNGPI